VLLPSANQEPTLPPSRDRASAPAPTATLLLALLASLLAQSAFAQAVDSEPARRPKICLVLSGGGARGVAHVGVLEVLEQMRVPIDCIVGTSMGSIVGGAYAAGIAPETMEAQIRAARWDRVLADQPPRPERSSFAKELDRARISGGELGWSGGRARLPKGAIIGHQLEMFLRTLIGANVALDSFDQLPIPFRAVTTDIGTGRMVVLDRGTLTTAMRASMSVPGVFAPQRIEQGLYVDGGLVRNLPIDVARSLGADVIIAVNLGSPLLKPDDIESVLDVAAQTLQILTEQNVERSLAELRPDDVLIVPELGDFSAADFEHSGNTIAIGVAAARAQGERLRRLALGPADYANWRVQARRSVPLPQFAGVALDPQALAFVGAGSVRALIDTQGLAATDQPRLQHALTQLLATDDFERVRLAPVEHDGKTLLDIRPEAKSWGPDYYRFGLGISTDFEGRSAFNLLVDQRLTWLTPRGLEWRNRLSLGDQTALRSELRQPLDAARSWFAAVRAEASERVDDLFFDDLDVAQYRQLKRSGELALGRNLGSLGELQLGYEFRRLHATRRVGLPQFPSVTQDVGALHAGLVVDALDSWEFPRSGRFLAADLRLGRPWFGADTLSRKLQVDGQQAFGGARQSVLLGVRLGSSFGGQLQFLDAFDLGGFQNLSGYPSGEFLVDRYALGRAIYQRQVAAPGKVVRGFYLGGSIEAAALDGRINGATPPGMLWSSSLFMAIDTALGPFYVGTGLAEGGQRTLFLYLGRP
jgi:NTE family protein